jgi:hypothetical protein
MFGLIEGVYACEGTLAFSDLVSHTTSSCRCMCARHRPVHAVLCAAGVEVLAKSLRTLNVSHNLVSRLGKGDVAMLKGAVPLNRVSISFSAALS